MFKELMMFKYILILKHNQYLLLIIVKLHPK